MAFTIFFHSADGVVQRLKERMIKVVCHKAYIILVVIPSTIERYTYGNTSWGDQLTAFNGTSLSYDALGNPLSYYNGTSYTFTWEKGRQLASTVKGGVTTAYTYNADGIRTGKTVGSKTVKYVLSGSKIVAEINNGVDIRYLYDPQGSPVGMILAGTTYLYEKNLQGDIIGIYNTSGTKVASYTYDAWGNVVSSSYSDYNAYTYNPFRYRGYYYDTETGFYYLQSRYYDPTTGRFISADGVMSGSGSSVQGYNLYAYCFNNPTGMIDADGNWPEWFKKGVKWVAREIIKPIIDDIQESLSEKDATYSTGYAVSGTPGIFPFSAQAGISVDTKGNIAIQVSESSGVTTSDAGWSVARYRTVTNAPSIAALEGEGYQIGGSIAVPFEGVPVFVGEDLNIIPGSEGNYYGVTNYVGIASSAGAEGHIQWGTTDTIVSFNIFEEIDELYNSIMEW